MISHRFRSSTIRTFGELMTHGFGGQVLEEEGKSHSQLQ